MKFMSNLRRLGAIAAAAAALASPLASQAASDYNSAASGVLTATAALDLEIVVEKFIWLRVGTGTTLADNATVDKKTFTVTAAINGNSSAIAADSTVAVAARGNTGNLTLTDNATGNFTGTASAGAPANSTIPVTAVTVATTGTAIVHGVWGASRTLAATDGIVNATDTWTYSYANTAVLAAGTYATRVTYTLTSL